MRSGGGENEGSLTGHSISSRCSYAGDLDEKLEGIGF